MRLFHHENRVHSADGARVVQFGRAGIFIKAITSDNVTLSISRRPHRNRSSSSSKDFSFSADKTPVYRPHTHKTHTLNAWSGGGDGDGDDHDRPRRRQPQCRTWICNCREVFPDGRTQVIENTLRRDESFGCMGSIGRRGDWLDSSSPSAINSNYLRNLDEFHIWRMPVYLPANTEREGN